MNEASPATAETPPRQIETTSDGWVYDLATGEVIGRVETDTYWQIDSPEAADRALELRAQIEADILAIDARFQAVASNLRALRAEKERRLNWWEWKFHSALVGFARSQLTGKSRTARFAYGSVAFRKTPATTSIIDDAAALEFVETWKPEAVTIKKSVNAKAVHAALEAARPTIGDEPLPFIVTSQPGENVKITTGIDPKAREQ